MWTKLEGLLVLTLLTGDDCAVINKPVQLLDVPLSPLDSAKELSDLNVPSFWAHGSEYATEPPSCQMACTAPVIDVLSAFFRAETFKTNMYKACSSYNEALSCMVLHGHCGADSMFDSVTSGLKYMCKEQVEAFKALADCIDENSARVERDCDTYCHSTSLATGLLLKDTVMTQLDHPLVKQNVNMRKIIEPHMTRLFFSEGCRIAECVMGCTRTKYNMLCEGTAGSLLLEVLTRPLSTDGESFPTATHLASFLGGFLPRSCGFLTMSSGRSSFRIDPELDKEIKRMYSDKNRLAGAPLSHPLSEPVQIENPFIELPEFFHRASPIDIAPVSESEVLETGRDIREDLREESEQLDESSGLELDRSSRFDLEGSGFGARLMSSSVSYPKGRGFYAEEEAMIHSGDGSGADDVSMKTSEFSRVESGELLTLTEPEASGAVESGLQENWSKSLTEEDGSGVNAEGSGFQENWSGSLTQEDGSGVNGEGSGEQQNDLYFLVDEINELSSYPVQAAEQYRIHTLADSYVEALQANSYATSTHKKK